MKNRYSLSMIFPTWVVPTVVKEFSSNTDALFWAQLCIDICGKDQHNQAYTLVTLRNETFGETVKMWHKPYTMNDCLFFFSDVLGYVYAYYPWDKNPQGGTIVVCRVMSQKPTDGMCEMGWASPYEHLGRRLVEDELPVECAKAVLNDLKRYNKSLQVLKAGY